MKLLTRKGYLIEEQGMTYLADTDPDAALAPLQSATCTYRIAFGPRAGQKVLSLQTVPSQAEQPAQERCVNAQGFSLRAEVPPAIERFANIRNEKTRRVYKNDVQDFMGFVDIQNPGEFRIVTRAHVIAWRDILLASKKADASMGKTQQTGEKSHGNRRVLPICC